MQLSNHLICPNPLLGHGLNHLVDMHLCYISVSLASWDILAVTPPKMNECPLKKDHVKKKIHLPTIIFQWIWGVDVT